MSNWELVTELRKLQEEVARLRQEVDRLTFRSFPVYAPPYDPGITVKPLRPPDVTFTW